MIKDQFTTHTYTLHDGRVVYSKGNDHVIDALLVREQANFDQVGKETLSLIPVLTDPVFICNPHICSTNSLMTPRKSVS